MARLRNGFTGSVQTQKIINEVLIVALTLALGGLATSLAVTSYSRNYIINTVTYLALSIAFSAALFVCWWWAVAIVKMHQQAVQIANTTGAGATLLPLEALFFHKTFIFMSACVFMVFCILLDWNSVKLTGTDCQAVFSAGTGQSCGGRLLLYRPQFSANQYYSTELVNMPYASTYVNNTGATVVAVALAQDVLITYSENIYNDTVISAFFLSFFCLSYFVHSVWWFFTHRKMVNIDQPYNQASNTTDVEMRGMSSADPNAPPGVLFTPGSVNMGKKGHPM